MRSAILAACLVASSMGAAAAQTRMPEMAPAQMSPEQKAMYDAIMAGPRHSMEGPFNMWLRSPDLGNRLQRVGERRERRLGVAAQALAPGVLPGDGDRAGRLGLRRAEASAQPIERRAGRRARRHP